MRCRNLFILGILLAATGGAIAQVSPTRDLTVEQATAQQAGIEKPGTLRISARVDRQDLTYAIGETVRILVEANEDAYVTIVNVGPSGHVTQLFPNAFQTNNRVLANRTIEIPSPESGSRISVTGPLGGELIKVFASNEPIKVIAESQLEGKGAFRSVKGGVKQLARNLEVMNNAPASPERKFAIHNLIVKTISSRTASQSFIVVPGTTPQLPAAAPAAVIPSAPAPVSVTAPLQTPATAPSAAVVPGTASQAPAAQPTTAPAAAPASLPQVAPAATPAPVAAAAPSAPVAQPEVAAGPQQVAATPIAPVVQPEVAAGPQQVAATPIAPAAVTPAATGPQLVSLPQLEKPFSLLVAVDKAAYRAGERVTLGVTSMQPCRLTVYDLNTAGTIRVLFPNESGQDNSIAAMQTVIVSGGSSPLVFEASGPAGTAQVIAVCLTDPAPTVAAAPEAKQFPAIVGSVDALAGYLASLQGRPVGTAAIAATSFTVQP